MTPDDTLPQAATVPLARDNEQRLAKMRKQLGSIHLHLDIAHNEVAVAADAAKSVNQPQLEKVLREAVAPRLSHQLKALAAVIERLGGTTNLSEGEELTPETPQVVAAE